MTSGTQPVSGAPIAQYHRVTQSVAVQNRPITTSFPSLGRPVNHREAEYAPQFRNAHFAIAACQIDLVFIFRGHVLRSSLSNIFYRDRKSTRLNSSHRTISYAVFCLKKKNIVNHRASQRQDYRGRAPFPCLSLAKSMSPITKDDRSSYRKHANLVAITVASPRGMRQS